jgi:tRNA1Val (adenine37-N6)-methyltransferase
MFVKSFTVDKILRGKISIIQLKKGFRYGFDTVFLAAFVNGYLKKLKKKKISLADVGSGVGTISLIIAYQNDKINITAIENNDTYLEIANENIVRNNFQKKINLMQGDIFNIDNDLMNRFDIVVTNPPFYDRKQKKSENELDNYAKRIINYESWIENSLKLLKDKGIIFLIIPTGLLEKSLIILSKKTGSFKIFPIWPNQKKSSKRLILLAKKGGASPTELMSGMRLLNNRGKITKKARTYSDNGIFNFL